jgi:type IV fimbrial biogenesis protein FimT
MSGPLRSGTPARLRAGAGFSLTELLVALAIMAILVGAAVPAYYRIMASTLLSRYTSGLVASTLLARGEAIRRNTTVTMCVSANGSTCGTGRWEQGWLVMCRTSDGVVCNSAGAATLVIDYQPATASGWKLSEANALEAINFDSTGTGANAATITLCKPSGTTVVQRRQVKISAAGRPSSSKLADAACS